MVTRSLVSYDPWRTIMKTLTLYWKVTRSLVSYDIQKQIQSACIQLKGHQIIGELRLYRCLSPLFIGQLKGHQIIGELRPYPIAIEDSWVIIERSPDHWWVTTEGYHLFFCFMSLKGHQIIGELRPALSASSWIDQRNWKVTRSLVSYDKAPAFNWDVANIERSPDHWWVTTDGW